MRTRILALLTAALLAAFPVEAQRRGHDPGECRTFSGKAPPYVSWGHTGQDVQRSHAVRDSVTAEMRAAGREAGIAAPEGLVVLRFANGYDRPPEIHRHNTNVGENVIRQVVERRVSVLATLAGEDSLVHFRLDSLALPGGERTTHEECRARVINEAFFLREISTILRRETRSGGNPAGVGQVEIRMLVARDGRPAHVSVVRRSGWHAVERLVVEAADGLRFDPATVDGVPVESWVILPVHLSLQP